MSELRLDYRAIDKVGYGKILEMLGHIAKSGLEATLIHQLYLRVSQINGCSYCIDLHWKDAQKAGVDARKLNGVMAWIHMPFFTPRERAAFAWAEALTRLEKQDVPQDAFEQLRAEFTEEECVAITHAVTQMNGLNRLAIAFGQHPEA